VNAVVGFTIASNVLVDGFDWFGQALHNPEVTP